MDQVNLRTRHTSARVSYDGSFSTDTKQHKTLPPDVLLELVHSSGVVAVSEVAVSTKLQVISTMKSLIHDRGPKQSSSGSPWVGSVEGVGDVKEIFADGTFIIIIIFFRESINKVFFAFFTFANSAKIRESFYS